jgi:hypothetical protein
MVICNVSVVKIAVRQVPLAGFEEVFSRYPSGSFTAGGVLPD